MKILKLVKISLTLWCNTFMRDDLGALGWLPTF